MQLCTTLSVLSQIHSSSITQESTKALNTSTLQGVMRVSPGAKGSLFPPGVASPSPRTTGCLLPMSWVVPPCPIFHLAHFTAQRTPKLISAQVKAIKLNKGKRPKYKLLKYMAQEERESPLLLSPLPQHLLALQRSTASEKPRPCLPQ